MNSPVFMNFRYQDWMGGSVPPTMDSYPSIAVMSPILTSGSVGPSLEFRKSPPKGTKAITTYHQSTIKDLLKSQAELKGLISLLRQSQSVQPVQLEHASRSLLEEIIRFRKTDGNENSEAVLDMEMIADLGHFLAIFRKENHANIEVLPHGVMSTMLHAIFRLIKLKGNVSIRITENVPHFFGSVGNLLINEHKSSDWAAYLLAHLVLEREAISIIDIHNVENIINGAFKLTRDGSIDQATACLLLINNFVAVGKDEVALFIARHSCLAVLLEQTFNTWTTGQNNLKVQRIVSIIHHLSRVEKVTSILILKKVPELLYELKDVIRAKNDSQDLELSIVGLATMALSNLSPSLGSTALKADSSELELILAFLTYALEGKVYAGISFRTSDVLRALTHLCSYQPNQEVLLELGLIELLSKTLLQDVIVGSSEYFAVAEPCWKCATYLCENNLCVKRMISAGLADQVEEFLSSQEADTWPETASKLLWILIDQSQLQTCSTAIISQCAALHKLSTRYAKEYHFMRGYLKNKGLDKELVDSANIILQSLRHENKEVTELSKMIQEAQRELEWLREQSKQKEMDYARELQASASRLRVMEEERGMVQVVHARACQNLVNDLETAKNQLQLAESELGKLRQSSQLDLQQLQHEVGLLQSRVRALQEEKDAESALLARVRAENETFVADQYRALEISRQESAQHESRIRTLADEITRLTEKIQMLSAENSKLSEKTSWLEKENALAEAELRQMKDKFLSFDASQVRLKAYEEESRRHAQAMEAIKAELEACQRKLLKAEEQLQKDCDPKAEVTPGSLGVTLTFVQPRVCTIYDLMDPTRNKQGQPKYSNEAIQAGDELVEINGHSVENLSFSEIKSYLHGAPETVVSLAFRRQANPRKICINALLHLIPGTLGLIFDTGRCPFKVTNVDHVLDRKGVRQGQPGYLNEPIKIGDALVEVNGNKVDNCTFSEMVRTLQGSEGTVANLVFRRPGQEKAISVSCVRHKKP